MKRFAFVLILSTLPACGGGVLAIEHCASAEACPTEAPGNCERWACTDSDGTDPRSGVPGCFPVPLADGAACDNGNPECAGHCAASACKVDVTPLPATCGTGGAS